MAQGKKVDDQTRAMIVAALTVESAENVAKAFHVAPSTVYRIQASEPMLKELAMQKKEDAVKSMEAFMDGMREQAQNFVQKALAAISSEAKLEAATLSQIATAMGIVIDKWGKVQNLGNENESGVVLLAPVKDDEEGGIKI